MRCRHIRATQDGALPAAGDGRGGRVGVVGERAGGQGVGMNFETGQGRHH